MTLRLILVRHGKSSWGEPTLDDHDRPLNDRGRRSASAVGRWLADNRYRPDQVMSSTSARTRETWARIEAELGGPGLQPDWMPLLYHAAPQDILQVLRGATGACVLLLGHNPGIGFAAQALTAVPPPHARFPDYPTAATTIYDFDIAAWPSLEWGTGRVLDFAVPRDLGVT